MRLSGENLKFLERSVLRRYGQPYTPLMPLINGTGRLVQSPGVASRRKRLVERLIYQYIHHDILPEGIFEVIKPIYVRLQLLFQQKMCKSESDRAAGKRDTPCDWARCLKERRLMRISPTVLQSSLSFLSCFFFPVFFFVVSSIL